jgi:Leucine rich repeat
MPNLWQDDERSATNRSTNLSGSRFSTRNFSVDQSVDLIHAAESVHTNLSGVNPGRMSGTGFGSSILGLFRGGASGPSDGPPSRFVDEYGDAAPSTESEEYISDKTRRMSPLIAQIRGFMGTKYFAAVILATLTGIVVSMIYAGGGGVHGDETSMQTYIVDQGISSASAFQSADSPQSLALKWVSHEGRAHLNPEDPGAIDRYILAVFYYGSDGHKGAWKSSKNWLTTKGVCSWEGVQCIPREVNAEDIPTRSYDANDSIIGLMLPSFGIEGTIPSEFAGFPQLITLDLTENNIKGTIPTAFGTMKSLRNLILRRNTISGTLPTELMALSMLLQLHVGENNMTGYIPDDINLMTSLRTLSLSSNSFEGFFPYLESCVKLVRIHVDNNNFDTTLPPWLGDLADLSEYCAGACQCGRIHVQP